MASCSCGTRDKVRIWRQAPAPPPRSSHPKCAEQSSAHHLFLSAKARRQFDAAGKPCRTLSTPNQLRSYIDTERSPDGGAGYKVHREFRTQRRPLNVAFVLRRTVEQGTSCPDAREDVSFRKMDRPPSAMGATPPARPFWRLQPCCPDLPWWGDPLRQPSCRAAS